MEKKKKKTIFKNIIKKTSILMFSALLIFTSVFSSYDMNVDASSSDKGIIGKLYDFCYNSMYSVQDFSEMAWDKIAGGVWDYNGNYIYEAPTRGNTPDATLDWYINPSETGEREHGGGGKYFGYQYNKGVETPQNTTNYNTTRNMSIHNENKTWNTTTNNYDYTYNWYNPITNTYNTTNEYTYNTEYNMYNYVTYDIDYTTNYYIQDNRTYVSYYIINVNNETKEEERDYVEMYYELPDGRNSLYLTVDDIKGQYFPSNYSKYVSVAEDDGITLGLWHLDGDLKDSSYHGNAAGSSYTSDFANAKFDGGYNFSDSDEDFLELKFDKINLPDTWTLEWVEKFYSDSSVSVSNGVNDYINYNIRGDYTNYTKDSNGNYKYYYYDKSELSFNLILNNYLCFDGNAYEINSDSFISYALVFDGSGYKLFKNGVLSDVFLSFKESTLTVNSTYPLRAWTSNRHDKETAFSEEILLEKFNTEKFGLDITSNSIKFYSSTQFLDSHVFDNIDSKIGFFYGDVVDYVQTTKECFTHPTINLYSSVHKNSIIDEVRLSSGVLYTGDTYTPSSQAFTTNTVLAVPENPSKHEIAFKTNTDISEVRFGGARPTYPTNGYVYVSLDADDKVESIQQYQEDGWFEIEASLYTGTDWTSFKNYNMEYLGIDGVGDTDDSGGDSGDDTGGDSGDTGDDSSGGGVSAILEGIGKFFDTLLTLVGKIIGMLSDFVNSVLTLFESFTVFTDGFSGFLTGAFGFIPQEAINVIVTGITLLVILAIIKFLK